MKDTVKCLAQDIALSRSGRVSVSEEVVENGEHVWHDEIFEWAKDLAGWGWFKSDAATRELIAAATDIRDNPGTDAHGTVGFCAIENPKLDRLRAALEPFAS